MRVAGIDVGSRTIKLAVADDGAITRAEVRYNSHEPISVCRDLLADDGFDRVVATGYGRHLFSRHWECDVITEIKAVALGARRLHPGCRTILDIGGQDTKVVGLDDRGAVA